MKKKVLAWILALTTILTMVGCGGSNSAGSDTQQSAESTGYSKENPLI